MQGNFLLGKGGLLGWVWLYSFSVHLEVLIVRCLMQHVSSWEPYSHNYPNPLSMALRFWNLVSHRHFSA